MNDLLLFPYSGTAIEAIDCLGNQWKCLGFVSDDTSLIGQKKFGIEIFDRTAFQKFPNAKVLAVHGSPQSFLKRKEILQSLNLSEDRFATVIHEKAFVSPHAKIGKNVLVMAGSVINATATVGDHVIVLPNSVIHHDSIVGDYTLIAANNTIAGNVTIGKNCYVGAGSTIKNGISVGDNVLIGMGSNVVKSVASSVKIKGNPAKEF